MVAVGSTRLPDFVIIGAQKAASTLMLDTLRQHPQIWMPRNEDPYFRDPVFDADGPATVAFRARYSAVPAAALRVGLKCPDYLGRAEVPARLADVLDQPKLVAILRSPIQRAVSAYYWRVNWGLLPLLDAETGLNSLLDGGLRDSDPGAGAILEWGLYHQHLTRYLEHFERDRLHIVLDSDLRSDASGAIAGMCRFLDVEPSLAPSVPVGRTNQGTYSPARLRWLRRRNKYVLRWNEDRSYAEIPRPNRPWPLAATVTVTLVDRYVLARTCDNTPPKLSDALQQRLWRYYESDVASLAELLGRDLSSWRPAASAQPAEATDG